MREPISPTNNASPRRYYDESGNLVTPRKGPAPDASPGPGAYSPNVDCTRESPERTVFGFSKQRERQGLTYISAIHSQETPPLFTPGPGTYRLPPPDAVSHKPVSATWKFGSADQQSKTTVSVSPGPKYDGDSAPPTIAPAYSFAPPNNELGLSRRRDEANKLFISQEHCVNARASNMDRPGPASYDIPDVDIYKLRTPRTHFSHGDRSVKDSLSNALIQSDPTCGSSKFTPGPGYDLPSAADTRGVKIGTAPRTYAPELGATMAGPFISIGHLEPLLATESPGPIYDSPSFHHEHPAYSFPEASTGRTTAPPVAVVPGPGAYRPLMEHSSKVLAMPVFSMGDRPPQVDKSQDSPGPAAYNVGDLAAVESRRSAAPAYSLGQRTASHEETASPGPGAYFLPPTTNIGPRRGFSFGGREKTLSNTFTSSRYHGPLAMANAHSSMSPGPQYDLSMQLGLGNNTASIKFGTAERMDGRRFLESSSLPGPGAYNVAALNLSAVSSRCKGLPGTKFSKVDRFNNPAMSK